MPRLQCGTDVHDALKAVAGLDIPFATFTVTENVVSIERASSKIETQKSPAFQQDAFAALLLFFLKKKKLLSPRKLNWASLQFLSF